MAAISRAKVKSTKSLYDLNSILKFLNGFLCILSIYLYSINGANEYVNIYTIGLAAILGLENIGMLFYEKRRRNPFIIILVFNMSVFYLLRVVTLIYNPSSATFIRDSILPGDINYSIVFIILSNISIFLGLYTSNLITVKHIDNKVHLFSFRKLYNLFAILFFLLILIFISNIGFTGGAIGEFFVLLFFHQEAVLIFTFCFLLYYEDSISRKTFFLTSIIILTFIIFVTIAGSRSGILTAFYLFLFSVLVVKKRFLIRRFFLLIGILVIPISLLLFVFSTFNRNLELKEKNPFVIFTLIKSEDIINQEGLDFFAGKLFERIGFLDYNIAMIAKPNVYADIISTKYYFFSIVDNLLTPGFDIFNAPKATHVIGRLANGEAIPTRSEAASSDFYQSDMMGIYGEYYVWFFGYPALIVFFLISFFFQRLYNVIYRNDEFVRMLFRAIILSVFFTWLNSFGTDWILIEVTTMVATGFFLKSFYLSPRKKIQV
ncbi:MAG: hypothetical protein Q8K66_11620 [Sediminibacterium sp.]|nr:hypothetical protein [Sediminibacterium sp.]